MGPATQGQAGGSGHPADGGSGPGIWLRGWDRWGYSPVWATVAATSVSSFVALTEALAPLDPGDGPSRFRTGPKSWGVPLSVPAGAERDDVHASLVTQLLSLAALIDTAGLGGTTEEPTEAPVDPAQTGTNEPL